MAAYAPHISKIWLALEMSNKLDCILCIIASRRLFGATEFERGVELMTKNEQELINIIRTSEDPQKAVMTAIDIICHYIKQPGSLREPSAADLQVSP